ncbi:MAG: HAD family hydrolase [Candidatus Helarchaeota archaeon]|nr:HAD family hydrolase [Candidatus Helarchaeota archaeon]
MSDPTKILVIFDLDFTLIDNSVAICNAFNNVAKAFQRKPFQKAQIMEMIGIPLKEMFLSFLGTEDAEKAVQIFRDYYQTHFSEGLKLIPGAKGILQKLKKFGYNLALLTSKKTELAEKVLEYLKIKIYFAVIVGEQKEFKPKPDPASINYIMSKFSNVEKAFMVGDHPIDCLTARNAGIHFIGVLTGNHTEQDFQNCIKKDIILLKSVQWLNPASNLI